MVSEELICMTVPVIVAMAAMMFVFMMNMKKVPPGKAMVIYGRVMPPGFKRGFAILSKGGKLIIPVIEGAELLDMGSQKIELDLRDLQVTVDGIDRKAKLTASAVVRIPDDKEHMYNAAESILHVNYRDVGRMAKDLTEAHIRTILRTADFNKARSGLLKAAQEIEAAIQADTEAFGVKVEQLTIHELDLRGG